MQKIDQAKSLGRFGGYIKKNLLGSYKLPAWFQSQIFLSYSDRAMPFFVQEIETYC